VGTEDDNYVRHICSNLSGIQDHPTESVTPSLNCGLPEPDYLIPRAYLLNSTVFGQINGLFSKRRDDLSSLKQNGEYTMTLSNWRVASRSLEVWRIISQKPLTDAR